MDENATDRKGLAGSPCEEWPSLRRQRVGPAHILKECKLLTGNPVRLELRPPSGGKGDVIVTVIVPLAQSDAEPAAMLATLPRTFEIILARGGTRASSMNQAAAVATGRHLWFVHADTTLGIDAVPALLGGLKDTGAVLRYFDLRFDGGTLMRLTELGVFIRSRLLQLPFGDQALCIPAATFRDLGGYDETAAYGEDHLLVRRARRAGIPVRPTGATITTSARKYRDNGWLRTTLKHCQRTLAQLWSRS